MKSGWDFEESVLLKKKKIEIKERERQRDNLFWVCVWDQILILIWSHVFHDIHAWHKASSSSLPGVPCHHRQSAYREEVDGWVNKYHNDCDRRYVICHYAYICNFVIYSDIGNLLIFVQKKALLISTLLLSSRSESIFTVYVHHIRSDLALVEQNMKPIQEYDDQTLKQFFCLEIFETSSIAFE